MSSTDFLQKEIERCQREYGELSEENELLKNKLQGYDKCNKERIKWKEAFIDCVYNEYGDSRASWEYDSEKNKIISTANDSNYHVED